MKKKNDLIDKAEIIIDPNKRVGEISKINDELSQLLSLEENMRSFLNRTEEKLSLSIEHDPEMIRTDTVTCICQIFDSIIKQFHIFRQLSATVRHKMCYIPYNATTFIHKLCVQMRKARHSLHCTKYLLWCILQMEGNVVLNGVRYLQWRTTLYTQLAFAYEDIGGYKAAYKVIQQRINKLNELRLVEEQQSPIPEYIQSAIGASMRELMFYEHKYSLLSGVVLIDKWKKKLEENFGLKVDRLLSAINAINTGGRTVVFQEGANIGDKVSITNYLLDMLRNDMLNIKAGIVEYIEKVKRNYERYDGLRQNNRDYEAILEENNQKDLQLNKQWRKSIKAFPIEIHNEVLKSCYDCKMYKEFLELADVLLIRVKYRRIECPYLTEIDVQMSSIPYSNIPNDFERIPIDLNINNYNREIKRLREEGRYSDNKENAKDSVKPSSQQGKKDKKKKVEENIKNDTFAPIEGMEHSYVYLLLRRGQDIQNAIVSVRIEISTDKNIQSKLADNERAIALPIRMFNTHAFEREDYSHMDTTEKILSKHNTMYPYLIYKKALNYNDDDKLNALTDLVPMLSLSPFANAPGNFQKLNPDITIKSPLVAKEGGLNLFANQITLISSHKLMNRSISLKENLR